MRGLPERKTPAVTVSHGSTRNQAVPGYSGINLLSIPTVALICGHLLSGGDSEIKTPCAESRSLQSSLELIKMDPVALHTTAGNSASPLHYSVISLSPDTAKTQGDVSIRVS